MPKHHYSEFTAQKIANYIRKNPGHKGKEIASALGLKKEHVNSWLYTHWIQQKYGVEVRNYCWYSCGMEPPQTSEASLPQTPQSKKQATPLQKSPEPQKKFIEVRHVYEDKTSPQSHPLPAASQHKSFSQRRKTVGEWKERIRTYTTEQIRKTFGNSSYDSTPDEFKVALWEVLQEREEAEKEANPQTTVDIWKQEVKKYSPEAVESAFANSNYNKLADEQKAALAEVLEEHKPTQVTTAHSRGFRLAKRGAVWTIISAGVLLVGFLSVYHLLSTITNNQPPAPSQGNPPQQMVR